VNKFIKILASVVMVLLLVFGGAVFYVTQKITPDDLRAYIVKVLEKTFPGANAEVGKLTYSIGTSVNFNLDKLELKLKTGKDKELFDVDHISLKVPLWALITKGGTVDLLVKEPEVDYNESSTSNNWKQALGDKSEHKTSSKPSAPSKPKTAAADSKSLAIPAILLKSKVNIKVEDIDLNYLLKDKSKGALKLSKVIIKDLNLNSSTAYEVISNINVKQKSGQKLSLDVQAIGQVDINKYLKDEVLETSAIITTSNLKVSGISNEFPEIKTNVQISISKDSTLNSKLNVDGGNLVKLSTSIKMKKDQIHLNNISLSMFLKEALAFGPKLENISPGKSEIIVKGSTSIINKKITPKLNFELTPGLEVKAPEGINIATALSGRLSGKSLSGKVTQKAMGGQILTDYATTLDLSNPPTSVSSLSPLKLDIIISSLGLSKTFIRKFIYSSDDKEETKTASQSSSKTSSAGKSTNVSNKPKPAAPALLLPSINASLSIKDVKIANEVFDGKGSFYTHKHTFGLKNFNYKFSKGLGKMGLTLDFLKNNGSKTNLNMSLTSLNLDSLEAFLPSNLEALSGAFSGTVKGGVTSYPNKMDYDLSLDLDARNGEVKGLNIKDHVKGLIDSIPLLKGKVKDKNLSISDEFKKLTFVGRARPVEIDMKSFQFIGVKDKVDIRGNGVIFPLSRSKKGQVDLIYIDRTGKISSQLQKNIGTDELPVRMTGYQYGLKPDYAYTIKKLSKKVLKSQKKKTLNKVKDKLKDNKKIQKILDDKKVNKFLKGLF